MSSAGRSIHSRKSEHIRICVEEDVESGVTTGLERFRLEYDALPEMDLDQVDTSLEFLGKRLHAPVLIGAITGGTAEAGKVNDNLAAAAERLGLGLCLGSQRAMIEEPGAAASYDVRSSHPGVPLVLGNMGAVQLNYGVTADRIQAGMDRLSLDGLIFHLNPLQEAIQPEGDTRFDGLADKLARAVETISRPCLVKEVGAGISRKTARKLASMPLAGIEAAGVGGTSWAKVEAFRAQDPVLAAVGRDLAGFGIPTAEAIQVCREEFGPQRVVIGSGGLRTGLDAAKAIALGADMVALARPLVQAAVESSDAVVQRLRRVIYGLKVVMFCLGARTLDDLRQVPVKRVD